ncbi:hypothetical protein BTS2_1980 [Bacillus sp. TS-2]|nr:hypothetical protein BTS2_1980 [Bacillus sp. TS-2]
MKTVKRKSSIHPKREPHHENGQKEKRYSPEKSAQPGKWSKESILFTRIKKIRQKAGRRKLSFNSK